MAKGPIPSELVIDDELYDVVEISPGRRQWDTNQVKSQPGDPGQPVPIALNWGAGYGATKRRSGGQDASGHHDYAENVFMQLRGIMSPSPAITYLDLSSSASTGFRFGGTAAGQFGGGANGLGGGQFTEVPQSITEFGDFLYIHAGTRTYTVDPAASTPDLKETKEHGSSGRARSADVFNEEMAVALGQSADVAIATAARGVSDTRWTTGAGIQMDVYSKGTRGRLFSAAVDRVFNVLPGQDPSVLANYLPSAGEAITDTTDPVKSMHEFAGALVAGTKRTLRTFDPDAGFQGVSLTEENRLTSSAYAGRALVKWRNKALLAFPQVVWAIPTSGDAQEVGPQLVRDNESPYVNGEPGVPDVAGDALYWPWYFPDTGDSVVFHVTERQPGEPGVGPLKWNDVFFLENRECRVVKYWGGTSSVKPRLFMGAGTTSNSEQIGWAGLGRGGQPDIFDSDTSPATAATIYGTEDDFDKPGVTREVERLEIPDVENADSTNYFVVSVSDDGGSTWKDLVEDQTGAGNPERVNTTGFTALFANTSSLPSGKTLKWRIVFTQDAATYLTLRGSPTLYLTEIPTHVDEVTTLIRVRELALQDDTQAVVNRLRDLVDSGKVQIRHGPDDEADYYGKIVRVREKEVELESPTGGRKREVVTELTFREVAVS
jgi:hypothetical protein